MDAAPVVEGSDCSAAAGRDAEYWFGSLDYLAFWVRRNPTPALVQVLPANLANFEATGGACRRTRPSRSSVRTAPTRAGLTASAAQLGMWLTPNHCWGVDASYLQLKEQSDSFFIASSNTWRCHLTRSTRRSCFLLVPFVVAHCSLRFRDPRNEEAHVARYNPL